MEASKSTPFFLITHYCMSNLLKFFLMALAWAVLWAASYYGCVKPEYCPEDEVAVTAPVTPAPAPVTDDYAIVSSLGSNDVLTGSQWAAERDALLAKYNANPNDILEIYGHYYDGEAKPDGYDNMGFLRAEEIKKLLVDAGIPAASIQTLARKLSGGPPADGKLFDAGSFAWGSPEAADQVVELDKDQIKIRFPFNESVKKLSANTEDYLQKLGERLKQTNEKVTIVGHTDYVDTDAFNMRLGQKRADFVKERLVSYGAPANRITTSSKGESEPEADNKTAAGRRLNRRAEITLIRE